MEYFEKAVAADTSYALAYAGMADAYFQMSWWNKEYPTQEGYAKAKEYASKSFELDKNLAEAHIVMGGLLTYYEWKWEDARKELQLALKLNPNISTGHLYYSELLDILRQNEEAREQINIAMELDPLSPMLHRYSSYYYLNQGKYTESLDEVLKGFELDPNPRFLYLRCSDIFIRQGKDLEAIEALKKWMVTDTIRAKYAGVVKDVNGKSGINGVWNWLIEVELKRPSPSLIFIASWYARLGRKEEALTWLEKALKGNVSKLPRINNDADFDNLGSEPRFLAIIEKMGLSDYK